MGEGSGTNHPFRGVHEDIDEVAPHRQEAMPDAIDLAWLREHCDQLERILRLQHRDPSNPAEDGTLHPVDEAELARRSDDTLLGALRRWAYLKHLYIKRSQQLGHQSDEVTESALDAMRRLLTREPVEIELQNGREVRVSDRSWTALYEIARHGKRIQALHDDQERIADLERRILERIEEDGTSPVLRRRRQWLRDLAEQVNEEVSLHRQAIYAHLTTEDGAPAKSLEEAPGWWTETTPIDDMLLIAAVHHVGPDRYDRLGEVPDRPDNDSDAEWIDLERFGWMTAFKRWDKNQPVHAAPCENRPMGQLLATIRAGADPVLDRSD